MALRQELLLFRSPDIMEIISKIAVFALLLGFSGFVLQAKAQTCSCAGAPLVSSQSGGTVGKGAFLVGYTFDFKDISDLYNGSNELVNNTVSRNTSTSLLEMHYGISERIAVTTTFTYVNKFRETGLHLDNRSQKLRTTGVGDAMLLVKYNIHPQTVFEQYQVIVGAGVKAPLGESSLRNNGFMLNADMQPGTGAWDGVLWMYSSKTFPGISTELFLMKSFRYSGTNERFSSDDRYRFGNEFVTSAGAGGRLFRDISYRLGFQFRTAASDTRNSAMMPDTGGSWVSAKPAFITPFPFLEGASIQFSGNIPVYQYVKGTQPTISYTLSASLFIGFGGEKLLNITDF